MALLSSSFLKFFKVKVTTSMLIMSLLGLVGFIFLLNSRFSNGKIYIVELTTDGFSPHEMKIQKRDSVKFVTRTGASFWPASDVHPTHLIYPEFDPKRPIQPDESWTFKFGKAGKWDYHDHLEPTFKGLVEVSDNRKIEEISTANCSNEKNVSKRDRCWSEMVKKILVENSINETVDIIEKIYLENPEFEYNCHNFMHEVGAVAFKDYNNHVDFSPSPKLAICAYGFYHGFLETLTKNGGSPKDAKDFCKFLDSKLREQLPDTLYQCYHGLAHGLVQSQENKGFDEKGLIELAKKVCLEISQNDGELFRCGSGIFDPISISYSTNQNGLVINKDDPFWLCREQTVELFKESCYNSLKTAVFWSVDFDFVKAEKIIESIPEERYAVEVLKSFALSESQMRVSKDKDFVDKLVNFYMTDAIDVCRQRGKVFYLPCVKATANALTITNDPSPSFGRGLTYCRSGFLSPQEKEACIKAVFAALNSMYPKMEVLSLCELAGEFRDNCESSNE